MRNDSDIVIIGSGVAGLSFAIKIAQLKPQAKISILSKSELSFSNTNFAQGGIAAVTNLKIDSFESHIEDTLKSGGGLSNPEIVKLVVESAPDRLNELVEYGLHFTLTDSGTFDLALEGGHSMARVVHAFDNTGAHLIKTLIDKASSFENISFFENRFCFEILKTKGGRAGAVIVLDTKTNELETFTGKEIVLATGGSGQVYKNTTNPAIATGDGVAMGIKAGAMVSNLNYVQFHPTALYEENKAQLSLLTEAIRGFGGHIVNKKEERFVFKSDKRGELATRDIVSKAIFKELKESGEKCVYLDCRHIKQSDFELKFPQITANLNSKNLHTDKDLIPVVPAAHYQCGGLKVNERGQTNVPGLYAIGECAETGLHGVNRLASNSLLEALVFGHEAALFVNSELETTDYSETVPHADYKINSDNDAAFERYMSEIKNTMADYATIASDESDLRTAQGKLNAIQKEMESLMQVNTVSERSLSTSNILINAQEIVKAKLEHIVNRKIAARLGTTEPESGQ